MNILAIDTASEHLSLALQSDGRQSSICKVVGNLQSNHLLPAIAELLQRHDLSAQQIDLITYNQGPGSFTGLRIGLSVALGMAYGLGIKLVPIPAFALWALGNTTPNVLVAIDARLTQVYLAGINMQNLEYFVAPTLCNPEQIPYIENCGLIGNGFLVYFDQLLPQLKTPGAYLQTVIYPNAKNLLTLVETGRYTAVVPQYADILYLRNQVAKTQAEQQANRAMQK